MSAPLIGLPGRRKLGHEISGISPVLADTDVDVYLADYGRGVIEAGGIPVNLPLDVDVEAAVARLDGVLLTGGADIDPGRYDAEPHPDLGRVEPERDEHEFALYRRARDAGLPVLGICRGIQLINVAEGGTLHQHVPDHSRLDTPLHEGTHDVTFAEGSLLATLYGAGFSTNSRHHQAVDDVGGGLRVTATASDGGVEGLEGDDDIVAVQWHPETLTSRGTDPIFGWLVETAATRVTR